MFHLGLGFRAFKILLEGTGSYGSPCGSITEAAHLITSTIMALDISTCTLQGISEIPSSCIGNEP